MRGRFRDGIWKRKDRGGELWLAWLDGSGRRRKKRAERQSYSLAKLELARLVAVARKAGSQGIKSVKPTTFAAYAERWMATHILPKRKPSTARGYDVVLGKHLLPHFGKLPLDRIDKQAIKSYLHKIADGKAPATVKNIFATLRAMLSWAVEDDLLEANPALQLGRFHLPKEEKASAEFLTAAEVDRFLAAAKEHRPERYALFLTAVRSGLRLGELIGLEWGDIQFGESENDSNRYILVRHNIVLGKPTTPKSRRVRRVDLNRELRQVLIDLRDQRMLQAMQQGEEMSPLVFPSETGRPLDDRNLYHRDFLPCVEAAGLRHVTFHSLRHSYASLLIQSGASLAYVKEQMGHSSIQLTVDVYGHLVPGENIEWVDRLTPRADSILVEPGVEPLVEPQPRKHEGRKAK